MEAELVGNFRQDSPEWHEARSEMVGASDVPIILGLSSFKSAFTLWHEKRGLLEPLPVSEKQRRKLAYGHHMEPFIAAEFASNHPELHVQETGTWRNIKRPWQGCNPDRLLALQSPADELTFTAALELKTFPTLEQWAEGVPASYRTQLLWQLDTFGFKRGYVAAYANLSGDYVEYEIEADAYEIECIRDQVWEWSTSEVPPEIDGSFDTYESLRRLNPSLIRGREVEVPFDVAIGYMEGRQSLKDAERELNKWKGHLLAHMGTAQYANQNGVRIASRVAVKDGVPYLKET